MSTSTAVRVTVPAPATVAPSRPTRDMLAAFLRGRGYTHDDALDPYDMHWKTGKLGGQSGPMLVCIGYEMNCELNRPTPGWNTYSVSVAT